MKKIFLYVFLVLIYSSLSSAENIEKRVLGFTDDIQYGKWFTFEIKPNDIFTLSFAGEGPDAGILIVQGPVLATGKTLCLLRKDDESRKLQNLMKDFMQEYGFGGQIKVDINNNLKTLMGLPVVKGKDDYISDTVLYYFLKTAQSSSSTDEFLINIKCK